MAEDNINTGISPPPPSYEDVIAAGSSLIVSPSPLPAISSSIPSFPPPARRPSQSQLNRSHWTNLRQEPTIQHNINLQLRANTNPAASEQSTDSFLDKLALFNMPNIMLNGLMMPNIPESELRRRENMPPQQWYRLMRRSKRITKLKATCCCLWGFGFLMLFVIVSLPVVMLLTGVFGINSCPFSGGSIQMCLFIIGSVIILTLTCRLLNTGLSCCKVTNVLSSLKSFFCSVLIAGFEAVFTILLVVTVGILLLSSWFMFRESPPLIEPISINESRYCNPGIYYTAIAVIALTYISGCALAVYLSVAGCSYYIFNVELNPKHHKRRGEFRRTNTRATVI